MPNTMVMHKLKAIFKSLSIAFFFFSFIVLIVFLTCGKTIDQGLLILNSMTVEYGDTSSSTKLNKTKKITRPSWGEKFATIKIPTASIELPVYQGDEDAQLAKGAGHYIGSYFPGDGGSIIIAAHNGRGQFHTLPMTKKSDIITLETDYGTFKYEVIMTGVIDYRDESKLPIQKTEEVLMLYTCYPVDAMFFAQYRFVVYAKLVGDNNE